MTSNKAFVLPLRNKHIKWIQRNILKYPGISETIELLENAVLNHLETPFQHLGSHNIILSFIEKAVNSLQEREQNWGTNLIASVLKCLHEVRKSLNEINNAIVQSDNKSHTDWYFSDHSFTVSKCFYNQFIRMFTRRTCSYN